MAARHFGEFFYGGRYNQGFTATRRKGQSRTLDVELALDVYLFSNITCMTLAISLSTCQTARPAAFRGLGPAMPRTQGSPRPSRITGSRATVVTPIRATGGSNGEGSAISEAGRQEQLHVAKMVNLVTKYFHDFYSAADLNVAAIILDKDVQHKDMVRNEGMVGIEAYRQFVRSLKKTYPDLYVKPIQFGVGDDRTLFVAFEGRATKHTPIFTGLDRFILNPTASKIQEVQVYRSNWLGAEGHAARKQAAATTEARR